MAHMLTIKDLQTRPEGTYYTGPLGEAKDFIRTEYSVTESSYSVKGQTRYTVMFGLNGDQVTWSNCDDYGNGTTMEESWRFALGAAFGPADDEFSAFPLTTNKTEAVRTLVDHHFPERMHVFYSESTVNAIVIDLDGMLWEVFPDGTIKVYK